MTGSEKYDRIGGHYNKTRRADKYIVRRLYQHLGPIAGGKYLDIGCGTGNYTIALSDLGLDIVGVDPSREMLRKAQERQSTVLWRLGKSEDLALDDGSIDGAVATLTLHHWSSLDKAIHEIARVLKPDGRIVVFTSTPIQMKGYWLNHYFPKMMLRSANQMPTVDTIETAMRSAGVSIVEAEKYFVRRGLEDLFLYSGKHNPARYLDEDFRRGISSFSNLASEDEIRIGLRKLGRDIQSRKVGEVIEQYKNDMGDYLFLIGERETPTR